MGDDEYECLLHNGGCFAADSECAAAEGGEAGESRRGLGGG